MTTVAEKRRAKLLARQNQLGNFLQGKPKTTEEEKVPEPAEPVKKAPSTPEEIAARRREKLLARANASGSPNVQANAQAASPL